MNSKLQSRVFTILVGLLSWLLFTLGGCAEGDGTGSSAGSAAVAAGQARFQSVCATCHGTDAKGLPRLGKGLIDNQFVQSKTDGELVEFLKLGRAADDELNTTGVAMPPKGGDPSMTEEDLQNLVTFLRALQ